MPSVIHSSLFELFRRHPRMLAAFLKAKLRVKLPAYVRIEVASEAHSLIETPEFRSDLVLTFHNSEGKVVYGLVAEVQRDRSKKKHLSAPLYQVTTAARFQCPVDLVFVTLSEQVAAWARKGFKVGATATFRPYVIGPAEARDIASTASEDQLEWTVVDTIAQAKTKEPAVARRLVERVLETLATEPGLDENLASFYLDIITGAAGKALKKAFEDQMAIRHEELITNPLHRKIYDFYTAEGRAEGRAEGEARGKAEALLAVLEARGLSLSDTQREQLDAATDPELVSRWFQRALSADNVDAIFLDDDVDAAK